MRSSTVMASIRFCSALRDASLQALGRAFGKLVNLLGITRKMLGWDFDAHKWKALLAHT